MVLLRLAWKNMWRNKYRTAITMAAIFFAVILSVATSSLYKGVFDNLVKNMVSFYSGYIQVHKHGYWEEQVLENSFQKNSAVEQAMLRQPNMVAVAPRLESFSLASSAAITRGCLVTGVDPDKEDRITNLKNKIIEGRYLSAADSGSVLLSQGLAERLQLKLNDTVILIGQGYHGSMAAGKYPVTGILHFGSPDLNDKTLFMPLALAQELFSAQSMITTYVLSLRKPGLLNETAGNIQSAIGSDYEVMTWEQMMPDIVQHMKTDTGNLKIIQGLLYLLIGFGIFSTLIMMMAERRFEMGMLAAIGMKKRKLALLLVAESVMTVITGCVLGILVSIPVVYYLKQHPIRFSGEISRIYERFGFEAIWPASMDFNVFYSQAVIVLVIGLLLALYPVYKIIRLSPVRAMKR